MQYIIDIFTANLTGNLLLDVMIIQIEFMIFWEFFRNIFHGITGIFER